MGGGSGEQAQNVMQEPNKAQQDYAKRAGMSSNQRVARLLNDYGQGKISLSDALAGVRDKSDVQAYDQKKKAYADSLNAEVARQRQAQAEVDAGGGGAAGNMFNLADNNYAQSWLKDSMSNWERDNQRPEELDENQFMDLLTTDSSSAQRYNQDRLRTDDLTKGFFGDGGMQDQSQADYKEQSDIAQGKSRLSEDDMGLYGQLSGNIARQFGSQEQGLAQALADRGLASAPSGVAAQQFSGMYGNKMEQLANAQRQVAQQRVDNAMQNAQRTGQMAMQLGQLGQNAMSNMYNRNLAGRQQNMSEKASAAGQTLAQQQAQQNQLNAAFEQQQATKGPSFGDVLGGIAGKAAGIFTGGVAGNAADSIFGVKKGLQSNGSTGGGVRS